MYLSTVQLQSTIDSNNCIQFRVYNKHTHPKMYELYLQHHIIPATSASIERGFSAAKFICSDRWNRLKDSVFESLVLAV